MMYQTLAPYYDALVQDEEATMAWVEFVNKHTTGKQVLELACGSGDVALALAKQGYHVSASDMSEAMLAIAKQKDNEKQVNWSIMDMRQMSGTDTYDAILCFCDSLNYILDKKDIKDILAQAYERVKPQGVFLFDLHSEDRLMEFEEEYCEDGMIDDHPYEWTIFAEDRFLYQNFAFYDADAKVSLEQHIQKIYDPKEIIQLSEAVGFQVQVYTDFELDGIQSGEKYFFVCKKGDQL